ncbi:MAG: hypothetical protein VR77_06185 [Flavobacteriales bacterium BRH_c54]|nr:MAG: hypothetical protein VR77_06185 [Flavobacteriales bacterium BRH_c54]
MLKDEINGITGSSYSANYWQYDSRLGRRWNVDPITKVHESPYAAFANSPIYIVDTDGKDTLVVHRSREAVEHGNAKIYKLTFSIIKDGTISAMKDAPTMYMMANKTYESKGDNDLMAHKYYKLFEDYMSHDSQKKERTIRVNKWGVFIHNGNFPESFAGCLAVSSFVPLYDKIIAGKKHDVTMLGTGDKVYKASIYAPYIDGIEKNDPDIIGGIKKLWDLYNIANGGDKGNKLTGDKFLLQPNSEARLEKVESKKVTSLTQQYEKSE